jgi:very-short-patch-repair endonuclease
MVVKLTKECESCRKSFEKPRWCGLPEWERRRFCSYACKAAGQKGQPTWNKGLTFESRAQHVPCRICGEPTRFPGGPDSPLIGKVPCDKPECVAASRGMKNQRISERASAMYANGERARLIGNWSRVRTISAEEELLMPWFESIGWTAQYRFVPGTRQRSFRLDFARPDLKLDVEIDGTSHRHADRQARDAQRDATLASQGWRVLRIQAQDVQANAESVRARILSWIGACYHHCAN